MAKSGTTLHQLDIYSDLQVWVTIGQMSPSVEASGAQRWYYFASAWHLVSLWVRLIFSQMSPSVETSGVQEWYFFAST